MTKQNNALIAPLRGPIFFSFLPFSFVAFTLPIYCKSLGANAMSIGGLFSIFTASTLVFRPYVGKLLDQHGRKKTVMIALLLNCIVMIAFAFANTLSLLYIVRFVQGFAFLLLTISFVTMVADLSSNSDRGRAMGIRTAKETQGRIVGTVLGFTLFGFLPLDLAWQFIFFLFAFLTFTAVMLGLHRIPETKPAIKPTSDAKTETHKNANKLVSLMVVVFIVSVAFSMLMPVSLIYMHDNFTTRLEILGLVFLPGGLALGFLSSHLGSLSDRFGRTRIMLAGMLFTGVPFFLVPSAPSLIILAILFFLIHVGWATVEASQSAEVARIVRNEQFGISYGWYDFSKSLGLTTGPLVCGWLYDSMGSTVPFIFSGIILFCGGGWIVLSTTLKTSELRA